MIIRRVYSAQTRKDSISLHFLLISAFGSPCRSRPMPTPGPAARDEPEFPNGLELQTKLTCPDVNAGSWRSHSPLTMCMDQQPYHDKTDFGDGTFGSATKEGHSVKRERPVQWPVSRDGACLNYDLEGDEGIQLYSAVDMLCTLGRYQVARQH